MQNRSQGELPASFESEPVLAASTVPVEGKEESQRFMGRTPQRPYALHFLLQPFSPELAFDILGVSRLEMSQALLEELQRKKKKDQEEQAKEKRYWFTPDDNEEGEEKSVADGGHVQEFKDEFTQEIIDALAGGFIQDERGIFLYGEYRANQQHVKISLEEIRQKYNLEETNLEKICELLEERKQTEEDGHDDNANSDEDALEKDIRFLYQLQRDHDNKKRELETYCPKLFETYAVGIAHNIPLDLNGILHFARLKKRHVYVWKPGEAVSSLLVLREYTFYGETDHPAGHVLVSADGHYNMLQCVTHHPFVSELKREVQPTQSALTLSPNSLHSTSHLSEWEEAMQLGAFASAVSRRESTQFAMVEQCTGLPSTVVKIVEGYMASELNLNTLMEQGKITKENFWQSVIGFFPIYACFPFETQGVPSLSLVLEKIRGGKATYYAYLETWGTAILLYTAKKMDGGEASMRYERPSSDDDDYEEEIDGGYNSDGNSVTGIYRYQGTTTGKVRRTHGRHPLFAADYGEAGYGYHRDALVSDPYITSLQTVLYEAPDLATSLLSDEDIAYFVHHYQRLQSIFISALLESGLSIGPEVEEHMTRWMPNRERPNHTLSSFQLLRAINRALISENVTLETLKTIAPIQHFLSVNTLAHIEDTQTFFADVSRRAYEFLDSSLHTPDPQEFTIDLTQIFSATKSSADLDATFKAYCLQKNLVPDWYFIFQYLLMGAKVDGEIIGHLANTGHTQGIHLLLQVPEVDVNAYKGRNTCLMNAAIEGHTDIVELFLRHPDIDVNQRNSRDEHTALALAVHRRHLDVVRLLVEAPEMDLLSKDISPVHDEDYQLVGWEEKLVPELAYDLNSYIIIGILFQALDKQHSVDNKTIRALLSRSGGDLRLVAASVAPNLYRFGSIALGLYLHKPKIVKLLSTVSFLNGDDALSRIARALHTDTDIDRNVKDLRSILNLRNKSSLRLKMI